ncbi:general transcription repressor [Tulasnella sp. 419]|nr:general transcription repressor [Tulasnella sp. 419]
MTWWFRFCASTFWLLGGENIYYGWIRPTAIIISQFRRSPDGNYVAAGSLDTVVRIWDVRDETLVERLRGHSDSVYDIAFTPDGKALFSASMDKTLKCWDLTPMLENDGSKTGQGEESARSIEFVGHKDCVLSVAVTPNSAWVVSGSKDRNVLFWDTATGEAQSCFKLIRTP